MKLILSALILLIASTASAQVCQPASVKPVADWVPTFDCQGWVPPNHALAYKAPTPAPTPAPTVAPTVDQDVLVRIDTRGDGGAVTSLSGFALDCKFGSLPPVLTIIERKPDGSTRQVPTDFFPSFGIQRQDVQSAYAGACPAVLNNPDSFGNSLGPNDLLGWSIGLRSPITEPGIHTFTAIFSWPSVGRSGSATVSITVR